MVTNIIRFNDRLKSNSIIPFGRKEHGVLITDFNINKIMFLDKLRQLAKIHHLGEVMYAVSYEGNVAEKIFSIDVPEEMGLDDAEIVYDKIIDDMIDFSKKTNTFDFFKDIHIIFKY